MSDYPDLDEYDPRDPEDYCDHEEYEVDWNGRASCDFCHHSWWLTSAQHDLYLEAEARWAADYDKAQRRERSWWMRAWRRLETLSARWPIRRRTFGGVCLDDEIPF